MILRIKDDQGALLGMTTVSCRRWGLHHDDKFYNLDDIDVVDIKTGLATIAELMMEGRVTNRVKLKNPRQLRDGDILRFGQGMLSLFLTGDSEVRDGVAEFDKGEV